MLDIARGEKELEQIQAEIAGFEKRIASYERRGLLPDETNAAIAFDFEWTPVEDNTDFPLISRVVQVPKDRIFYVKSLAHSYTVVGTFDETGLSATITLSQVARLLLFDYDFKISDSGSDREWQNDWLPGSLLATGNYNEWRLRAGHALASPGSELVVEVQARFRTNDPDISGLSAIEKHKLQIVLAGFTVPYSEGA